MRIDGNHSAFRTPATEGTHRASADAGVRPSGMPAPGSPVDRVELSSDAALRAEALKAASEAPDIRADLVDRLRATLESGALGADSLKLADAIIDDLFT